MSKKNKNPNPNPSEQKQGEQVPKHQKVIKAIEIAEMSAKVLPIVKDIVKFVNHPTWYSHAEEGYVTPAGMNFISNRSDVNRKWLGVNASTITHLTCVDFLTTQTNDDYAWDLGINAMYLDITKATGRTPNYTREVLSAYVHNVRAILAKLAWAAKVYNWASAFSYYDSDMPGGALRAMGADETWTATLAESRITIGNFLRKLRVLAPLDNDLMSRTIWLFSSAFSDSTTNRPVLMHHIPAEIRLISVAGDTSASVVLSEYDGNEWGEDVTSYTSFVSDMTTAFGFLQTMVVNAGTLAADILKTYGVQKNEMYSKLIDSLDYVEPILFVLNDAYHNAQMRSATFMYQLDNTVPTKVTSTINRAKVHIYYAAPAPDLTTVNQTDLVKDAYADLIGNPIIHVEANKSLDANEQTSITRLAIPYKIVGTGVDANLQPITVGTEQPWFIRTWRKTPNPINQAETAYITADIGNVIILTTDTSSVAFAQQYVRLLRVASANQYAQIPVQRVFAVSSVAVMYEDFVSNIDAIASPTATVLRAYNQKAAFSMLHAAIAKGDKKVDTKSKFQAEKK